MKKQTNTPPILSPNNTDNHVVVQITDYAFPGKGLAKIPSEYGDYVLFVPNTFPGQTVKARILKKKKRYSEASLIEVVERSPLEQEGRFQEISGAPYIFVSIEAQAKYKISSTLDLYRKLAHIEDIYSRFDTFVASPEPYFYRNKMEYSFSCIEHDLQTGQDIDNAFALGFKRRGTWWKVENLQQPSGLFDQEWEELLPMIRTFLKDTQLPAWHPPQKVGFFRHLVVRKSFDTNQLLVNLVTSSQGIEQFDAVAFGHFLQQLLGVRIAGFQHTINDDVADRSKLENGRSKLVFGEPIITEKINGLSFKISMESFFQTNPKCAQLLYSKALDYALEQPIESHEVVLDLFCGTGTIGQLLIDRKPNLHVVGVDNVNEAILNAQQNAQDNNLSENIAFFCADVGSFLHEKPQFINAIACVIIDPPRAGIAPKTLKKVIALEAQTIVYISCNPSTQARDTLTLQEGGYHLEKISLVDQFPHTGHIETIAKFKRKNTSI